MRDRTSQIVSGALRDCIWAHGPISEQNIASATKRIVGQLKQSALNDADVPDAAALKIAMLQRQLKRLRFGHKCLINQHERLRAQYDAVKPT